MTPLASWLLVLTVIGVFITVVWHMLAWIDRLLDRSNEWRKRP